jgi:MFS family permease
LGRAGCRLLIGAFATGAAVSGLALCLLKQVPRAGLVQLAAVMSIGLAVGVAPTLAAALTAAAVLGPSSGVFGTIAYALLLSSTPTAQVGRVMALLSLTLEGSAALSFLATGTLTTTLGAAATFLLGGLLTVATALTGSTRPRLRTLQMDQAETATQAKPAAQHEPGHVQRDRHPAGSHTLVAVTVP